MGDEAERSKEKNEIRAYVESLVGNHRDLSGADFCHGNLAGARLRQAKLCEADLRFADLTGADLTGADLSEATLEAAILTDADLTGAHIAHVTLPRFMPESTRNAHLGKIKADVYRILEASPQEVPGLLKAFRNGEIDGSLYRSFNGCACLVGTLARLRDCDYEDIPGIYPDAGRPAERWVSGVRPGDTPETSVVVAITTEWLEDWLERREEK